MSDAYESAIRRELESWPGVDVEFTMRAKHRQATFIYGDETRFIVMPLSPSDCRGHRNCVRDARKELEILGAERSIKAPAVRVPKRRSPARHSRERVIHAEPAPVKANPFDALASLTFPPDPPRLSFWRRFWTWLVA